MRPMDRKRWSPAPRTNGRRKRTFAAGIATTLAVASLLTGCAPSVPKPKAGYGRLVDPIGAVDASRLEGRRIVLDPGHGGFFPGARGVQGLTEAEVNLGVALELARLLREHGADVLLTRETDRDFLTPADSSLRSDLAERVRLANAYQPDLFVSIHHNADARGAHDVNETQVYYQLGDEGPALEAAADVHRFLTRNLGIGASRMVPGNFAVLRGSDAPALLTESSYITYPPTERKLRTAEARRLEAEAIYLGIARFFSRRAPVIRNFVTWAPAASPADSQFRTGRVNAVAQIEGAFDAAALTLDGRAVPVSRELQNLFWSPEAPLEAGPHELRLTARLSGEGTSRAARIRFAVVPSPDSIAIDFPGQSGSDGEQPIGARLRVLSREGVLVRDSLALRIRAGAHSRVAPSETTVTIRDGVAWAYFQPLAPAAGSRRTSAATLGWSVTMTPEAVAGPRGATHAELPMRRDRPRESDAYFAIRMPAGEPLREAPGTGEPDPALRWINRDGFVRAPRPVLDPGPRANGASARSPGTPALPGYRLWEDDALWPRAFVAIAGGALHDRRIVVDAAGGGADDGGNNASGGRGAALNLETARMLVSMLEAAGARVRMTRTDDADVADLERVKIAEAFHADRYVRIGHAPEPPRLGHYFSSSAGMRWAGRLADLAVSLGLPRPAIGADAQYPIQQTSATALYAGLGRVDVPDDPLGGFDPARLRREAYAIYLSLAREWAPDADWPMDSLEVRDPDGNPVAGAVVRLGDALVLQSDPLGRVRFARTEPGPMLVQFADPSPPVTRILLDSERGIVLTGPRPR